MKEGIHPEYKQVDVKCTCGATFSVLTSLAELNCEVCSQCHPFFTGAKRLIDSSGRVDKFQKRFADWDARKLVKGQAKK